MAVSKRKYVSTRSKNSKWDEAKVIGGFLLGCCIIGGILWIVMAILAEFLQALIKL